MLGVEERRNALRFSGLHLLLSSSQNDTSMKGKKPPLTARRPEQRIERHLSGRAELLIGRAVVTWSRLEQSIEEVIWELLKMSVEDGRIITARLDVKYKTALLRGLSEKNLQKDALEAIRSLLTRIDELYTVRNLIVHGVWGTVKPDNVPAVMSLREKLPEEAGRDEVITTHMPHEYMAGVIRNIMLVTNLLIKTKNELSSSLSISPEQAHTD